MRGYEREENNIANIITCFRMLFSILMIFCSVLSGWFYVLYLFCGISDMIDGAVARKTNSANEFGAKLDTVADFAFFAVSVTKLFPIIHIPVWLWIWVVVIAIIKFSNVITGFLLYGKLTVIHSVMNKVTGFTLFLIPLTMHFIKLKYSAVLVCFIATIAAIWECMIIRTEHKV